MPTDFAKHPSGQWRHPRNGNATRFGKKAWQRVEQNRRLDWRMKPEPEDDSP